MFVTFGASTGARIYVNGMLWGSAPAATYASKNTPFAAPYVRFYFGELSNNNSTNTITVHDVQLYDRELSHGDVASLTRGITFAC